MKTYIFNIIVAVYHNIIIYNIYVYFKPMSFPKTNIILISISLQNYDQNFSFFIKELQGLQSPNKSAPVVSCYNTVS